MCVCALCGKQTAHGGTFALCEGCRRQVCLLAPEDKRYWWYAAAVKRVLESLLAG